MQGGFTFCGTDIHTLGLEYAPDNAHTYVYGKSPAKIHEISYDAHDGGYFYGTSTSPKEFSLRCYFEEKHINEGVLTRIEQFFTPGRTGKQVFKKRPWVYYVATVTSLDTSLITNYLNGIVTITQKAYYPYGQHEGTSLTDLDLNDPIILHNSALLADDRTPVNYYGSIDEPLTEQTSILLYNGGTIPAAVAIEIAGSVGKGVSIYNRATKQMCRFVALSKATTSDVGKYVISDAINGKTVLTDGKTSQLSYQYHDYGFLNLKPAYPIFRNISVSYEGGTEIKAEDDAIFSKDMVGQHIFVNNRWIKIAAVPSSSAITVEENVGAAGSETTEIVTMNEIIVTPDSNMELTKINFIYSPTFG